VKGAGACGICQAIDDRVAEGSLAVTRGLSDALDCPYCGKSVGRGESYCCERLKAEVRHIYAGSENRFAS
jgi:hypothetical protein